MIWKSGATSVFKRGQICATKGIANTSLHHFTKSFHYTPTEYHPIIMITHVSVNGRSRGIVNRNWARSVHRRPSMGIRAQPGHSSERQTAVVVGGGPCGLAAAMMLCMQGYDKVDVLETRASPDYFEPDKSFVYNIDGRGQAFLDLIQGGREALEEGGVGSKSFALTRLFPDGKRIRRKVQIKNDKRESFWIPRAAFVRLMYTLVETQFKDKIKVHFGTGCRAIEVDEGSGKLKIYGKYFLSTCNLLVGGDGLKSFVRKTMLDWDDDQASGFEMQKYQSLSSGLRYKVLNLPPSFYLDHECTLRSIQEEAYVLIGNLPKTKERIRLGILPIKNKDSPRTANFITAVEDHKIWQITDGKEIIAFLEKALPQLPIREIVAPEEAQRFADSTGGRFPAPQYCERSHMVLNNGKSGIVLVGDAFHSFPPDLGQGVNAGLEDVLVLQKALREHNNNLADALPSFEAARLPDIRALIRLMQVGYPLQYNQAPFRRKLWTAKNACQLLLSKVLPILFFPPLFLNVQEPKLRYRDVLYRAEHNALRVQILAVALGVLSSIWMMVKRSKWYWPLLSLTVPFALIKLTYEKNLLSRMNAKTMALEKAT